MGSNSRFRKAIGRVKDQTSIGLAMVSSSSSLPDLEVAIVKATRHDDYPAADRHIQEILNLTSCSQAYVASCVTTILRRLNGTRNWVVALKALVLIQRLLQDGDPAYEHEIFFATRRGTRLLNMADFLDMSRSNNTWDFSAFVRMYAFYLDEQLEYRMKRRRGEDSYYFRQEYEEEEEQQEPESPIHEDHHHNARLQHLTRLLERFLACRPSGPAECHRIVTVALYPLVKQSFNLYYEITEILRILIDQFTELEIPESVKVYEIFCQVGKQYDELDYFYDWCKSVGLARTSEYPDVEKISQKKLETMDEFIREKSVKGQFKIEEPQAEEKQEPEKPEQEPEPDPEPEPEPDMNSIKALPRPEGSEEKKTEDTKESKRTQDVGDLLNLGDDAPKAEDLVSVLFDGGSATMETGTRAWEAYEGSQNWETALVETPSHLSNRRPPLPGGFNPLLLEGMYQQAEMQTAMANSGILTTGSASSVAFGSMGRPAKLALPPPASASANGGRGGDPFSASLPVAPPPYVQMAEMEKKQRLLAEEQMMWQQYQRDGLQGQVGLAKIQSNHHSYHMRGYTFPN